MSEVKYSSNAIKKAGKKLMEDIKDKESLEILSFFRSDHEHSLNYAFKLVTKHALEIEPKALVAKRLKRTPSIIDKLRRNKLKNTQLSTMQDIGGCRVVLSSIKKVYKLVKSLTRNDVFKIRNNYIENPKNDGYRSIHLIGKFDNIYGKKRTIELQIRTTIQHSWATAIEIVDLFMNDSIKCSSSKSKEWPIFFRLVSDQFIVLEDNPYLHSNNKKQLITHFRDNPSKHVSDEFSFGIFSIFIFSKILELENKFRLFKESIQIVSEALLNKKGSEGYSIINIKYNEELNKHNIYSYYYSDSDFEQANNDYLKYEKESLSDKLSTVALVSTISINDIEKAYPNYFADSRNFLYYLELINSAVSLDNPKMTELYTTLKVLLNEKSENSIDNRKQVSTLLDTFNTIFPLSN